jgi:hypothetical protein
LKLPHIGFATIVILLIGYFIGYKFPALGDKVAGAVPA